MPDEKTNVVALVESGKFGKADEVYLRWLDKHPEDWLALGNYADLQFRKANHGLAIHLYKYLLQNWKDMPPEAPPVMWGNIAQALFLEGFQDEAEYAFDKAIALNPGESAIYNARACSYINQGQPDKIIEWTNKALELDPGNKSAKWNRSIGYLEKGMWDVAWEGYLRENLGKPGRSYQEPEKGEMRMWDGKRNRCVVAWGEQGVGDEVMFASCLPDFISKAKNPIIDCHPRLERTFKRSFPGVPIYGTRKSNEIIWHNKHNIDSQIAMSNLPYYFRRKASDFPGTPYLKADPERIAHYRAKLEELGPGPYVGITWFGGEKKTRFDYRMIPLEQWGPILETGCTFVSLQYNKWGHKRDAEKFNIPHWDLPIEDLDEQMALIMACDLIISVNQSVVHFSGALGKECWCLTPARPAWRYGLTDEHIAWYGTTVKCIRQKEGDTWEPVINEAADRLRRFKRECAQAHGNQGFAMSGRRELERVAAG